MVGYRENLRVSEWDMGEPLTEQKKGNFELLQPSVVSCDSEKMEADSTKSTSTITCLHLCIRYIH